MADITIRALYGSVVEDEGQLFIGFAEGEDEDEGYVLFRQPIEGGPVWFEVNDEGFGAENAVEAVTFGAKGIEITLKPELAATFGWARTIAVRIGPDCEDAAPALEALRAMLGGVWRE
jgi:hypothetical protein